MNAQNFDRDVMQTVESRIKARLQEIRGEYTPYYIPGIGNGGAGALFEKLSKTGMFVFHPEGDGPRTNGIVFPDTAALQKWVEKVCYFGNNIADVWVPGLVNGAMVTAFNMGAELGFMEFKRPDIGGRLFVGLAMSSTMFGDDLGFTIETIPVERARQLVGSGGYYSSCNISHKASLDRLAEEFDMRVEVPEKAPFIELHEGDALLVMSLRFGERRTAERSEAEVASASVSFKLLKVLGPSDQVERVYYYCR